MSTFSSHCSNICSHISTILTFYFGLSAHCADSYADIDAHNMGNIHDENRMFVRMHSGRYFFFHLHNCQNYSCIHHHSKKKYYHTFCVRVYVLLPYKNLQCTSATACKKPPWNWHFICPIEFTENSGTGIVTIKISNGTRWSNFLL